MAEKPLSNHSLTAVPARPRLRLVIKLGRVSFMPLDQTRQLLVPGDAPGRGYLGQHALFDATLKAEF
jgi:hypothetical protein